MAPVQSKRLFNFRLTGKLDDDILESEKKMFAELNVESEQEFVAKTEKMTTAEVVEMVRGGEALLSFMQHPILVKGYGECDHGTLEVPTTHSGEHNVLSLVHTPKSMSKETGRPALIYAHGGGVIAMSAGIYKEYLSTMASASQVVVFNVDYRLAPETVCPNNVLDFYHTIKYIVDNAGNLGIDPKRIAIAGESGGGYICAGAMVKLAQQNESHLVKVAIPAIAMLSSYLFGPKQGMTKEEKEGCDLVRTMWKAVAGTEEIYDHFDDPLLFPGDADDAILAKMPPTIVWDSEFDNLVTENFRFANRLRSAGHLLEYVVIPGAKHGSDMDPHNGCFFTRQEAWRMALQEYLIKV